MREDHLEFLEGELRKLAPVDVRPTPDLRISVQATVARLARRRRRRDFFRVLGAVSAACAMIFAALWLSRPSLAQQLDRAIRATLQQLILRTRTTEYGEGGQIVSRELRFGRFGEGTPLSRLERRDSNDKLVSLELWRGTSRWSQPAAGAALVQEEQPSFGGDFRELLGAGWWLIPNREALGIQEDFDRSATGRAARTFSILDGNRRQVYYLDSTTGLLLQRDEEERVGDVWRLRRRLEIESGGSVPASLFEAPGSPSSQGFVDALGQRLSRPLVTWRGAGHEVAIRELGRNGFGEVFVLYTDRAAQPAAISLASPNSPFLRGEWFTLEQQGRPVTVDGLPVQGRWFVPRKPGKAIGPVTVSWRQESARLAPARLPGESPDYSTLFGPDFQSPLGYRRATLRSFDARVRRDAKGLLAAADESIATWSKQPSPHDAMLRLSGWLDKSLALRELGDAKGADTALAEAQRLTAGDPNPFVLNGAKRWR